MRVAGLTERTLKAPCPKNVRRTRPITWRTRIGSMCPKAAASGVVLSLKA